MVFINNSGPPNAKAALIFCSPYPGISTKVSLIIEDNFNFLVLLSIVAIIIESDLALSLRSLASVPINRILVIPGTSSNESSVVISDISELLYILLLT